MVTATTPISEIVQLAKGRKRISLRAELLHHIQLIQLGESAHFRFLRGYIYAALGTSLDENREPLERNYAISEIATESLVSAWLECSRFMRECATDLVHLDEERNGHNFWLTRNRYEAFWDATPGSERAEPSMLQLTHASQASGAVDLYLGDGKNCTSATK